MADERSYDDFDLLIEPARETGYRARVLSSPVGETRPVPITNPFSDLELENFLLRIGRPRRYAVRGEGEPEATAVREFGARLFDAVFRDQIRTALIASRDQVEGRNAGLRVRLRLTDCPELADLPWEYLYDGDAHRYLALSEWTPVVRYLDLPGRIRPLTTHPPLRILVLVASPTDFCPLDVEGEWARLREALDDLQRSGRLLLERASRGTVTELQRRLRRGTYHVLHYIGHGRYDSEAEDGQLALEGPDGRGAPIYGADLGALLHDHRTLRLALLNSCEGARGGRIDPYSGTAQSLIYQGIPAVVAMRSGLTDTTARTFFREFYRSIAAGCSVDTAITGARKAILNEASLSGWGTPTLTLRVPDGRVFDLVDGVHTAPPGEASTPYTPTQPPSPPSATPPAHAGTPRLIDDDVRFSVFRPRILAAEQWTKLLVVAHKSQPYIDPIRGVVDPLERVRRLVEEHYPSTPIDTTSTDARRGLGLGSSLRVVLDLPGVDCRPPAFEFTWLEDVHEAPFLVRPPARLAGTSVRGFVRIWCGPLILGELPVTIPVALARASAAMAGAAPDIVEPIHRYRKIFPSYSHRDREMVEIFRVVAHALGDEYLQDVVSLRSGELWDERLLNLIVEADVFQLFWSRNSMRSPHCRREWERALALRRPSFIRPLYWEDPLPEDPTLGLPPSELRTLHFAQVPSQYGQQATAQVGAPVSTLPAPGWAQDPPAPPHSAPSAPGLPPPPKRTIPAWEEASPYGQQRPQPSSGWHDTWAGGPPPPSPSAPQRSAPPRRRRWLIGGLIAAALAVAGGGIAVPLIEPGSVVTGSAPPPAAPPPAMSEPSAPSPPLQVDFELTTTLDVSFQASEVVTVYGAGRLVGTLEVDTASPTASLPVYAQEGEVAYELDVHMVLLDGSEVSCVGQGTIDAYEGATYTVRVHDVGAGCVAVLE